MIKDLIVNVTEGERDAAGPFAISIAEMLDAHPVLQGQPLRNLPGILAVEVGGHVPESRDGVEIRFVVGGHPADQHVGITRNPLFLATVRDGKFEVVK